VVSTAQHLTDLATELVLRGHSVTVLTGNRGYDNPSMRFPSRERWKGIDIIRLHSLNLGKRSRWRRALNFGSFLGLGFFRLLVMRRFEAVVALTSPPLISLLAALFVKLKGGRFYFWVMDLNPDEAIAAGWLRKDSLVADMLKRMLNYSLSHATQIIVLDRFMEDRLKDRGFGRDRISVVPPWSHDEAVTYSEAGRQAFRRNHGLSNKFVVMYSGNHSPCHPLDTLLQAALELRNDDRLAFCFVGGGSEQEKVRRFALQHGLTNINCLPYQPLSELSHSLSGADLHVVVMGNEFPGIVHPCKIYNILRIGTPTIYIGPDESHITDIAAQNAGAISLARHGDVQTVKETVLRVAGRQIEDHTRIRRAGTEQFSKQTLLPRMVELLETDRTLGAPFPNAVTTESA
jgi:colanic acid biosynthesis glycosyl transferase WcaI